MDAVDLPAVEDLETENLAEAAAIGDSVLGAVEASHGDGGTAEGTTEHVHDEPAQVVNATDGAVVASISEEGGRTPGSEPSEANAVQDAAAAAPVAAGKQEGAAAEEASASDSVTVTVQVEEEIMENGAGKAMAEEDERVDLEDDDSDDDDNIEITDDVLAAAAAEMEGIKDDQSALPEGSSAIVASADPEGAPMAASGSSEAAAAEGAVDACSEPTPEAAAKPADEGAAAEAVEVAKESEEKAEGPTHTGGDASREQSVPSNVAVVVSEDSASPGVAVDVDNYETVKNPYKVTYYSIVVTTPDRPPIRLRYRYSEIYQFHQLLKSKFAKYKQNKLGIPPFPSRKVLTNKNSPLLVSRRMDAFQKWMNALLLCPEIFDSVYMKNFLTPTDRL